MKALPLLFGLTAVVVASACSDSYADYCQKRNACLGGNDADLAACYELQEGVREAAQDYSCTDQYDNYAECLGTGVCNSGNFNASCDAQKKAVESCEEAASSLRK